MERQRHLLLSFHHTEVCVCVCVCVCVYVWILYLSALIIFFGCSQLILVDRNANWEYGCHCGYL